MTPRTPISEYFAALAKLADADPHAETPEGREYYHALAGEPDGITGDDSPRLVAAMDAYYLVTPEKEAERAYRMAHQTYSAYAEMMDDETRELTPLIIAAHAAAMALVEAAQRTLPPQDMTFG